MTNIDSPHPALFDTYNARFMDARQIAKSFVMPPHAFRLLCKNENSILIGPRGSGKTTLLKMLRPNTLLEWDPKLRESFAAQLDFTAVYVGTDSAWTSRISLYENDSKIRRILEVLQSATTVTYALDAMLTAISDALVISKATTSPIRRLGLDLTEDEVAEMCRALAKLWRLDLDAASIRALRFNLHSRIQDIDDIYFRVVTLAQTFDMRELIEIPYLSLDLVNSIQSFVSVVNDISPDHLRVWAFCIDEIEILPEDVQNRLLRSLRSVKDQRIRFKLSASPFSKSPLPQKDPTVPMGGHDFTPITLTYAKKHEAVRFGRRLLNALVEEFAPALSPVQLLGRSRFEPELPSRSKGAPSPYRPGGARHLAFSALEREDPGFSEYLTRRKIDLSQLVARSEDERAEVRKLIQIAEIRREFGTSNFALLHGRDVKRHRSRKRVGDLYTGLEALLTLCEGNPRWLIGMIRPLLSETDTEGRVPRNKQARSVASAIARYLALLTTIPVARRGGRTLPVTRIIDEIGEYFFSDITAPRFKTEPALSIIIDKKVTDSEVESIGAAVNQGAFIFIPGQENEHCLGDIRNKRFRLSYMLCPRYKLPLMYGQPIILSRVLGRGPAIESQFTLEDLINDP